MCTLNLFMWLYRKLSECLSGIIRWDLGSDRLSEHEYCIHFEREDHLRVEQPHLFLYLSTFWTKLVRRGRNHCRLYCRQSLHFEWKIESSRLQIWYEKLRFFYVLQHLKIDLQEILRRSSLIVQCLQSPRLAHLRQLLQFVIWSDLWQNFQVVNQTHQSYCIQRL